MKNKKLLECLFGHHTYSKKVTKDKDGRSVHLCQVCKRKALWVWHEFGGSTSGVVSYDGEGNGIRITWRDGFETVRNKDGSWVTAKWIDE